MIHYLLQCEAGHDFEGWFRNADTFDQQAASGEIACPICGVDRVTRAPMAPAIAKRREPETRRVHTTMEEARRRLEELRRQVEENCEYVGDRFAEEARKIHYKETPHRDIYGEATDREARELEEEGITFSRIPWVGRTDS